MVNIQSIVIMYLSVFLTTAIPLGFMIFCLFKKKMSIIRLLLGALLYTIVRTFLVNLSANLISIIPIIGPIANITLVSMLVAILLITFIDIYGKKIFYSLFIKNKSSKKDILSISFGQGFTEEILSVGLASLTNLTIALAINNGTISELFSKSPNPVEVQNMVNAFLKLRFDVFLLSGISGVSIILSHILIGFYVAKSINSSNKKFFRTATLLSLLFNSIFIILPNLNSIVAIVVMVLFLVVTFIWVNSENIFNDFQ